MIVRPALPAEDAVLAAHYLALWASYATPPEAILADAEARIHSFIAEARRSKSLGVFLAEVDGSVAGSAACQVYNSPYPEVTTPAYRQPGYIWSVWVEPDYRRRGIARALVERAVTHLRDQGCTLAILNASEAGKPLYQQIGFSDANEMRLPLR
jgi:ribosomal protein S18 acetylase RimI-like enzyme